MEGVGMNKSTLYLDKQAGHHGNIATQLTSRVSPRLLKGLRSCPDL